MARTDGTRSAARCWANNSAACLRNGSASCLVSGVQWAGTSEPRMTIMSSSYEPTSASAGHAATAAPVRP